MGTDTKVAENPAQGGGNEPVKPVDLGLRGLPLLREVLKTIDQFPAAWDQQVWGSVPDNEKLDMLLGDSDYAKVAAVPGPDCGTACCIAGWAVALTGHYLLVDDSGETTRALHVNAASEADSVLIEHTAMDLLGLEWGEAEELFHAMNDRGDIQQIAEEIAARREETL